MRIWTDIDHHTSALDDMDPDQDQDQDLALIHLEVAATIAARALDLSVHTTHMSETTIVDGEEVDDEVETVRGAIVTPAMKLPLVL
jgi:hypothetical protein